MKAELKRIIIFTYNVPLLLGFYSKLLKAESSYIEEDCKWAELILPNINIAFHSSKLKRSSEMNFKLAFYDKHIKKCREKLIKKGYKPGKIFTSGKLEFFNLNDPDKNVIQFTNRK